MVQKWIDPKEIIHGFPFGPKRRIIGASRRVDPVRSENLGLVSQSVRSQVVILAWEGVGLRKDGRPIVLHVLQREVGRL